MSSRVVDSSGAAQSRTDFVYTVDEANRVLSIEYLKNGKVFPELRVDVSYDDQGRSTVRWDPSLVLSETMLEGQERTPVVDERMDLSDEFVNWTVKSIGEGGQVMERHYRTFEYDRR